MAIGLLRRRTRTDTTVLTGPEAVIDADAAEIPVGIDGEAVDRCQRRCTARSGRERCASGCRATAPECRAPKTRIQWDRLWRLAFGHTVDPVRVG